MIHSISVSYIEACDKVLLTQLNSNIKGLFKNIYIDKNYLIFLKKTLEDNSRNSEKDFYRYNNELDKVGFISITNVKTLDERWVLTYAPYQTCFTLDQIKYAIEEMNKIFNH